ncbi:MAG TPA: tRNA-dihydrouridine synthase, partial [Anaerovoracaceae bacterium]|nr:tRNA-dihydrouridine synthase [Anaerovoracaceae bacterium]
IGWDESSINAIEVAKAIESGGASAVAVHGRTREQYYSGKANWDIIRQVKESVRIPVIGNGDIACGQDAIKLMEETGCDFVMIARGSMGNPWIFRDAFALWSGLEKPEEPTLEEKISIVLKHIDYVIEAKGEYVAVREMRKHVAWYLKGIRGSADIRRTINTVKDTTAMKELLQEVKNR